MTSVSSSLRQYRFFLVVEEAELFAEYQLTASRQLLRVNYKRTAL